MGQIRPEKIDRTGGLWGNLESRYSLPPKFPSRKSPLERNEIMNMDYSFLRKKIKQHYPTQKAFAEAVGMSEQALSRKLNNKASFTVSDIYAITETLNISSNDEIHLCFFMHSKIIPFKKRAV